ncbi:MAG: hypothetical protein IKK13_01850, partial [Clostridia bacterium]|nr:hypothetical protein [Clostridia bacterium]
MSEKIKACSFTGYRPNKFDFPFSAVSPQYKEFENRLLSEITAASARKPQRHSMPVTQSSAPNL